MRGEKMKQAVQEIEKHSYYATTSGACRKALLEDSAEGYRQALHEITTNGNRRSEYAVNIDKAEKALREDR